jgi:ssDNA-binding replication factor A large subunit
VCATHGAQEGNTDVRLRMVLDDGESTISLIINKDASESLIKMNQEQISDEIQANGTMAFVQSLREILLGRKLKASGRTIVDEQGAMLLSDHAELIEIDSALVAAELRNKWGVV